VEYYHREYCCVGTCITQPDVIFEEPVEERLPVEDMEAFIERDRAHREVEEAMIAAEAKERFVAAVDKMVPPIPEQLKGTGLTVIVGSLLVILLIITVIITLFRRSAAKRLQSEQEVSLPPADLQQAIDSMVSKGLNYAQVRDYLLRQGIPQDKIDQELRRNYESRRSSQPK
jgi:hypothetical protein